MAFSASAPIGKSDNADSPIVEPPSGDDAPLDGATCTFQGESYGYGAVVCMGGTQYQCGNSGWYSLNTPC